MNTPGFEPPQTTGAAGELVSVVIPCYNQSGYLVDAIESVMAQDYPRTEIIVVDDGSTDNLSLVLRRYSAVRSFRQENAGPSAARNNGLQHSRGKYVVFLDADDRLLPRALSVGVACLDEHPECAFAAGQCRVVDSTGAVVSVPKQRCVEDDHYAELLGGGTFIWCPGTVVYQRWIFDFVQFDPASRVEDYDLYLRITRDFQVHCHDAVVAEYRQHRATRSVEITAVQDGALAARAPHWQFVKANKRLREAFETGDRFWREEFPAQQEVFRASRT